MATIIDLGRPQPAEPDDPPIPRRLRIISFMQRHASASNVVLLELLVLVSRTWNLAQYPGLYVDEGFYTMQAWSTMTRGDLAPYTYIYDHPFLMWVTMGLWFAVTGSLPRHEELSVMAGREFMVLCAMLTAALLYALARRLGASRSFAFLSSLLWVASPLANTFSRLVLLDNFAMPFVLAAMILALSPKRNLWAMGAGSGACMAAAIWSKEVAALHVFGVALMVWRNSRGASNRWINQIMWWLVLGLVVAFYPGYAATKGELWPGLGHVSWWEGQVLFQLVNRNVSGSVLDPASEGHRVVFAGWLIHDKWLPWAGIAAMLIVLLAWIFRLATGRLFGKPGWASQGLLGKLVGPAVVLATLIASLFRASGYIPFAMTVMMMPYIALLTGCLLGTLWSSRESFRIKGWKRELAVARVAMVLVVVPAVFILGGGVKAWTVSYHNELTVQQTQTQRLVSNWFAQNLTRNDIVVTEAEVWLDAIRRSGLPQRNVVMTYKLDADPAVMADIGDPMKAVTLTVIKRDTLKDDDRAKSYPSVLKLGKVGTIIKTFGPPNTDDEWLIIRNEPNHPQT